MRRVISLILAVFMVITLFSVSVCGITYEQFDTVFSGFTTLGFEHGVSKDIIFTTEKQEAYPYYHYTAVKGNYTNNSHVISLKPKNVLLSEYPVVKVYYRTDSPSTLLDVSILSPKGENWMKQKPALNSDGEWHTLIFNYNEITAAGKDYIPNTTETDVTLRFKPFGTQTYNLENNTFFDIGYVAMFKTNQEAENFNLYNLSKPSYKYNVLTPNALFNRYGSFNDAVTSSICRVDNNNSYVRYKVAPGTYGNNLLVNFSHDAFPLVNRPYIKLVYRTDSPASRLDLSMMSEKGENWAKIHPVLVKNGEVTELVYSINDLCGAQNVAAPDENSRIQLRLKPWGSHSVTLTKESYFDILYVAFFETEQEANAFEYAGDSAYAFDFEEQKIIPDYSFASNEIVREYIDQADKRIDDIIHTNNTVPFKENLTVSGFDCEYSDNGNQSVLKVSASKGKYPDKALSLCFNPADASFAEYKYINFSYRTDITSTAVVMLSSSKGSASKELFLSAAGDGFKQTIISLATFKNYDKILSGNDISLTVFPLGVNQTALTAIKSFDIEYFGIFKTKNTAANFIYGGEHGGNLFLDAIIYTPLLLDPSRVPKGRKVFVAKDGSNSTSNYGEDPEKPVSYSRFLTINNTLEKGATVFFKRGDVFRITNAMQAKNYVTYTSYGVGNKPKFIASIDGSDAENWIRTKYENVWLYNQKLLGLENDVGHIKINGGKLWGIKVSAQNHTDNRVNNGYVYNGRTFISGMDGTLQNGKGLVNDLEFWHDYANGKLYLYCADGNPGEVFDNIEIANKGHAIQAYTGAVVDNLYITGAGSHGVSMGTVKDVTVSNMHLEWIGGSIQNLSLDATTQTGGTPVRYGNAIEVYGSASNFTIKNSFCDRIYDCCFTVQNQGAVTFDNVLMYDNVARYSNTGLEVWQSGGITNNMHLHHNYTLFSGYGWSHQRPNKDGNFFYGGIGIRGTTFTNNSVDNNINILASNIALFVSELGSTRYNFNNNVYVMGENKIYTNAPANTEGYGTPEIIPYNYSSIQNVVSQGTDKGSVFYYLPENTFNIGDNPYKVFSVNEPKPTLYKEVDGKWYYYVDDARSYETTLVKYNGKWFYIVDGVWDKSATGLVKYSGKWFYVKNGKWSTAITDTLIKHEGKWFYIKNGKWDKSVTETLVKYKDKWFYIKNGKWDNTVKTICTFKGKKFYIKGGKAQLDFSGKVTVDGKKYTIKGGKVV